MKRWRRARPSSEAEEAIIKNQINNVLAFPGIFRGALDCRAKDINEAMKVAASYAIANLVADDELSADYIIPKAFDKRVGPSCCRSCWRRTSHKGEQGVASGFDARPQAGEKRTEFDLLCFFSRNSCFFPKNGVQYAFGIGRAGGYAS